MPKILSARQIKDLDVYTIQQEPVASIDLMERACRAFVTWFTLHFDATKKVGIVCGTGNNGGDGLGIARMLHEWGYRVKVWIVRGSVTESEDFKKNFQRIPNKVETAEIVTSSDRGLFSDCDVLIDAIFGSGLSRSPEGIYAQAINCINQTEAIRVAVDIPSGLMVDRHSTGEIVQAHYTVSFQLPKLSFFLPQSHPFTGEWILVDIGLKKDFIQRTESPYHYLSLKDIRKIVMPRSKFSHKGTFGHTLIIAGSFGKMGAAVLCSKGALRAGSGLTTTHVPRCGYNILQVAVPEVMASVDRDEDHWTVSPETEKYSTIAIGPGLGQEPQCVKAFKSVLQKFRKPVVIDADGLNMIASNRDLLELVPPGSILTPHPKEFERIVGGWNDDFERLEKQQELAASTKSVIILKGAFSSIALPNGKIYFNSTGNPGMATGGTGDVLTGILAGLMAQSYKSEEAALAGTYLHGLSADIVARERGSLGMTASDIVDFLPLAFKKLLQE